MLNVTKNRFYLVPVLTSALDILELISSSNAPLKMNEIARGTGVSQTTAYRIVRTLVHRGYLAQDLEGRFGVVKRRELKTAAMEGKAKSNVKSIRSAQLNFSGEQVIEIIESVLQTLRQEGSEESLKSVNPPGPRIPNRYEDALKIKTSA